MGEVFPANRVIVDATATPADKGSKLILELKAADGSSVEYVAPFDVFERIMPALIQASGAAFEARAASKTGDPRPIDNATPSKLIAYRFGVSPTGMLLRLVHEKGQADIGIQKSDVAQFRDAVVRNTELLLRPPGHQN